MMSALTANAMMFRLAFIDKSRVIKPLMHIKNSMHFQSSFRLEGRDKKNRIIEDNWKYVYNQAIKHVIA